MGLVREDHKSIRDEILEMWLQVTVTVRFSATYFFVVVNESMSRSRNENFLLRKVKKRFLIYI